MALPFGESAPPKGAGEVRPHFAVAANRFANWYGPLPSALQAATFPRGEGFKEEPL